MSGLSNYIDRKSSGPGSSEKSQNVHSANWQAETQLKKEVNCIHRQEQQSITKISTDQRILIFRFHRKLTRSVDLAKSHEKLKSDLEIQRQLRIQESENDEDDDEEKKPQRIRHALCMSRTFKPPVPRYRRGQSLSEPINKKQNTLPPSRPVTAMENRSKMWERQLKHVTSVVQRAKSAPPGKRMPLIEEFKAPEKKPKGRVKTARGATRKKQDFLGVDMDEHRKFRQMELHVHERLVNNFLNSIQDLKLQPWTPGMTKKDSFVSVNLEEDENEPQVETQSKPQTQIKDRLRGRTGSLETKTGKTSNFVW